MARLVLTIDLDDEIASLHDDVLARVVDTLRRCGEPGDLIFQTGATRFAILAPDVDLSRAGEMSERLRASVRESLPVELVARAWVRTCLTVVGGLCPRAA